MAQVIESLPSKPEVLSSNLSTTKKKKWKHKTINASGDRGWGGAYILLVRMQISTAIIEISMEIP
jgi:hypothetical protein